VPDQGSPYVHEEWAVTAHSTISSDSTMFSSMGPEEEEEENDDEDAEEES